MALKGFPLRMDEAERAIVEDVQASFAAVGVTASLNDVIRHLIRRAEIPIPANVEEAQAAILEHWGSCDACRGHRRPRCTDGVLVRREWQRHLGLRDGRAYALQPVGSQTQMCGSGEGKAEHVDETPGELQRVNA